MLKIYGVAQSRAFRTLWMAEEIGVPYEHVKVGFVDGKIADPEFARVNPNAKIPSLEDGGAVLFESLAMNLYLAAKYDKGLKWRDDAEAGRIYQWSFWGATEIEQAVLDWAVNAVVLPPEKRNADVAAKALKRLEKPMAVLEGALAGRKWLCADRFTVGDLNVASLLWRWLKYPDLDKSPATAAWLRACWDRPAAQKAVALREG